MAVHFWPVVACRDRRPWVDYRRSVPAVVNPKLTLSNINIVV